MEINNHQGPIPPFPGKVRKNRYGCVLYTKRQWQWVTRYYPYTSTRYMAEQVGVSFTSFKKLCIRHGLKKVDGFYERKAYFAARPDKLEGWHKSVMKRIRRERFNIRMGLHQETRIRLYLRPYSQKQKALRFRGRKMGYRTLSYLLEGDPRRWIIYYDEGMRRHTVYERHSERLGFSFRPSSEMFPGRNTGTASVTTRSMSDWML